jgi:hypothetical protein
MTILLVCITFLLVLFLVFFLVGVLTQAEQTLSRNIFLKAPLDEVWEIITDIVRHIEWRDNLQKIEIKDNDETQMVWVEIPKQGKPISYKVINLKIHKLFEAEMVPTSIYSGSMKIEFTSSRAGITLRITDTICVKSVLRRPFSKMSQELEQHANQYQDNLRRYFEKPRTNKYSDDAEEDKNEQQSDALSPIV